MKKNTEKMDDLIRGFFSDQKILPILTIEDKSACKELIPIFVSAGLNTFEVTLRTENALEVIKYMSQKSEFVVGAGTLLSSVDVKRAINAGAKFGVSPGVTTELLEECEKSCFPLIPGVSTSSEIMTLYSRGYRIMKFFPAESLGGVRTLKALSGPFPKCHFFPTGGINEENASEYLGLSNVYGVAGSWVAPRNLINDKNWSKIKELAKKVEWKR